MAEKEKDYSKRDFDCRSKSFKIDVNNPQEGQCVPDLCEVCKETRLDEREPC